MLENNLLAQFLVVLLSAVSFLIILESVGFLAIRLINRIWKAFNSNKFVSEDLDLIPRIFLGGLVYALVFLGIGWLGLLTKSVVIGVSLLLPIIGVVISSRWRNLRPLVLTSSYARHRYVIWGSVVFLVLTFVIWFRPATSFDATWYHLTVPKLFLDHHTVNDLGVLVRYSLQPTLTYFWNLWPLSLPISTPIASIVINAIQAFMLALALTYATIVGARVWSWNNFNKFTAPLLVGGTYVGVSQLGSGGNDVAGLTYGLVAALYCFLILRNPVLSWRQFLYAVLLIVGLASIKIFFSLLALVTLIYLLAEAWSKLPAAKRLIKIFGLLIIVFAITYLPWIIRSYIATGRILDPIGTPGLNEEVYVNEGGGTAINHWTNFVFARFYSSIWPVLTFIYSPLVLLGAFSLLHKPVRREASSLWLVAFTSLWAVFFASIALQWRYYLPSATLLIFLGVASFIYFIKSFGLFGKALLWCCVLLLVLVSCVRVIFSGAERANSPGVNGDLYASNFIGTDNFLNQQLTNKIHDYNQQTAPSNLSSNERILVANVYYKDTLAEGIHNLAYIDNPILEPRINEEEFRRINSTKDLKDLLGETHVRYALSRAKPESFCKSLAIADSQKCSQLFLPVLYDKSWKLNWYKIVD